MKNLNGLWVNNFLMAVTTPFALFLAPLISTVFSPRKKSHPFIITIPSMSVMPKSSNSKQTKIIPIKSMNTAKGSIVMVSGVNLRLSIYKLYFIAKNHTILTSFKSNIIIYIDLNSLGEAIWFIDTYILELKKMASKIMLTAVIVSLMIASVVLTGCMGASVAPSTSVAGQAIGSTDLYPYVKVGEPTRVDNICIVKNPDLTIRKKGCSDSEFLDSLKRPSWKNGKQIPVTYRG